MPGLDEIVLDPLYLSDEERAVIEEQFQKELNMGSLDEPIAEYVREIMKFPFIATIRSCSGHNYPGHISFRFTKEWHEKFIQTGIKPLLDKDLCQISLEAGRWLPTETGLFFRWKARFNEDKREEFFKNFLHWLKTESQTK